MIDETNDLARQALALSEMAAQGVDIWEAAVGFGLSATSQQNLIRYSLGEAGCAIATKYGDASFDDWRKSVRITSLSTAQHYRRIVKTFGLIRCIQTIALDIDYTFMRDIVHALKDSTAANAYLDAFIATPSGQTPPQLVKVSKPKAKTLIDINDAIVCDVNAAGGFIVVQVGNGGLNLLDSIGKPVHLIVKEVQP